MKPMYLVVKVLLSVIAALMVALATSSYLEHRQQEQKEHAEQFRREMQRAGSKNWGNSAKTIQTW